MIEKGNEIEAILKTDDNKWEELKKVIKELHPYTTLF